MNKTDILCLWFACNMDEKEIILLRRKLQNNFEQEKCKKHLAVGKTTSHRSPKKDLKLTKTRNAMKRLDNIIRYQKAIKTNEFLAETVADITVEEIGFKSLENFIFKN